MKTITTVKTFYEHTLTTEQHGYIAGHVVRRTKEPKLGYTYPTKAVAHGITAYFKPTEMKLVKVEQTTTEIRKEL
jgi:hypothetical protein